MTDLIIPPYQPADRQAVFQIGADTAFFGNPVEANMEDRCYELRLLDLKERR